MIYKKKLFELRIEPQIQFESKYDINLEGLRGFCALGVLLAHGLGSNNLDSDWKPSGIYPYLTVGTLAVFLFFMLSGYVIGLNKSNYNTLTFYKKRILRLYPIYLFAFAIYFILIGNNINIYRVIGNLFMLQNERPYFGLNIPVISELAPIWSINYEFFYYIIFPIVLIKKPRLMVIILTLLTMSIYGYYNNKYLPMFITDYSFGYLFWLGGLIIAWFLPQTKYRNHINFISYAFLILSYHHFSVGTVILKSLNIYSNLAHGVGLETIFYLPLCFLVVTDLSMRQLPLKKIIKPLVYIPPLVITIYLIATNRLFEDMRWIASLFFYVLSILTYSDYKYSLIFLKKLSYIGSISYAIYVIHWPLMLLVERYYPDSGDERAYIIKFIIWIAITFVLSHILEKKMQPKIRSYFLKR